MRELSVVSNHHRRHLGPLAFNFFRGCETWQYWRNQPTLALNECERHAVSVSYLVSTWAAAIFCCLLIKIDLNMRAGREGTGAWVAGEASKHVCTQRSRYLNWKCAGRCRRIPEAGPQRGPIRRQIPSSAANRSPPSCTGVAGNLLGLGGILLGNPVPTTLPS